MNDHLKTSQSGLELIAKWEGIVLKPYKDIAGLRTIGIGHLIKSGENFPDGVEITREKAFDLLASDVAICEEAIKKHIKAPLNQNQFDALVSFGFNCGTGVYVNSGVATAVNSKNFDKVPEKLTEWSKARVNGVLQTVTGLLNRRKHEAEVFMKPDSSCVISNFPVPWNKEMLKEAQSLLKELGLYALSVDGVWGPGTKTAVEQFAESKSIEIVDSKRGVPASFMEILRRST